jgi:ribosomal protein L17
VNEEQILQLLESTAKEYRELAESLVPRLRSITMNNRHASEVALEVAAVLDKLIAKIRNGSINF